VDFQTAGGGWWTGIQHRGVGGKDTFSSAVQPILEYMRQRRRLRGLSKAFGEALKESRNASAWPGGRLPVSLEIADHVENLAQQIQLETKTVHCRRLLARHIRG
jgi:hypothetical protein